MLTFVTVMSLTALLSTAITTATTIPSIHTQIRVQTFKQENCGGAYEFLWLDPNVCIEFAAGAMSMRVVGSDGEVRWDARMFLSPALSQKNKSIFCGARYPSLEVWSLFCFGDVGVERYMLMTRQ
jgi:hypothetical protein